MKDQYVADIGDYGKYSLLRAFAKAGVNIGINWYYTGGKDKTNDGKHTKYLNKPEEFKSFCPEVFNALKDVYEADQSIKGVEDAEIIPDCCYFGMEMKFEGTPKEREERRGEWFANSLLELASAELIYLDPDNGLLTNDKVKRRKVAVKYALPEEVKEYFKDGKNVVYYCHKGRRQADSWEEYKTYMLNELPSAKQIVLTYHKGTQRSYVFLIHTDDYDRYNRIVDQFVPAWDGAFEIEFINKRVSKDVHQFALKWLHIFQHEYNYYKIFSEPDFGLEALDLGFVLDKGQVLSETFPEYYSWGDVEVFEKCLSDKRMNQSMLESAILSYWRYFNHWAMDDPKENDVKWFIMALNKLAEMTKRG